MIDGGRVLSDPTLCIAINILGTLSEPVGDAENKDERKAAEGFKLSRTRA